MFRHTSLIPLVVMLIISVARLAAQSLPESTDEDGEISMMIHTSLVTGISPAMQGGLDDVVRDVNTGGEHVAYPGLGMSFLPHSGGIQLGYRFPASAVGLYIDGGWTLFRTRPAPAVLGMLLAATVAGGVEGELWRPWRSVVLFGRGGINASSIGGEDASGKTHIVIRNGGRLGAEGELGGRYTWEMRHFAIEMSACYRNLNIIGKRYLVPLFDVGTRTNRRGLNDGARPGDPTDHDRTIDLLALRLGARLIF